jgi:hypothetical protein
MGVMENKDTRKLRCRHSFSHSTHRFKTYPDYYLQDGILPEDVSMSRAPNVGGTAILCYLSDNARI